MKRRVGVFFSYGENTKMKALMEEIIERGGMSTEEMIKRFEAIPLEEFIEGLKQKIRVKIKCRDI